MFNLTDNKEFGNNDINILDTNNIKTIYKTEKLVIFKILGSYVDNLKNNT